MLIPLMKRYGIAIRMQIQHVSS